MPTHTIALADGTRLRVELPQPSTPASVDGIPFEVDLVPIAPGRLSLLWTDASGIRHSFDCLAETTDDGPAVLINGERVAYSLYDPRSLRQASAPTTATGPMPLKSPMPGRIVRILVTAGQHVEAGEPCLVIEAMKMQNELKAPRAGTIAHLHATQGAGVDTGTTLLVIE